MRPVEPHHGRGSRVGMTGGNKKYKNIMFVVLDSGAFIGRRNFFNNFSPDVTYFMTPAVNNEVRDKTSRFFLQNFPFEIVVRKPDPQSSSFVSQFLSRNRSLKSMSRTDRQLIALAHTLELEHEGSKNLRDNKVSKSMSVVGGHSKPVKKSKTGRIHTVATRMVDTGVRLAKLKKVIAFHFDDFMTLSLQQYGEKYGRPSTQHHSLPSNSPMTKHEDLKSESEHRLNGKRRPTDPEVADDARSSLNGDTEPLKLSPLTSASRQRHNSKGNVPAMNALQLNGDDAASEHSELDKMLEQDHELIKDTESIISELTDQSMRLHSKETKQFQAELEEQLRRENPHRPPRFQKGSLTSTLPPPPIPIQAPAPPIAPQTETVSFGTMFAGGRGSLFGTVAGVSGAGSPSESPLPPLHQNAAAPEPVKEKKKTLSDGMKGEWISAENLEKSKKERQKKTKMEAVPQSTNQTSSVAVITVDVVMQRAMCDMGLRVLTTRPDRQMQSDTENRPVQVLFRCYGCYNVEHDTTRTHCRTCGGMTFQRMSVYVDDRGKTHERYSTRDRFNRRYLEKNHLVPRGGQLVRYNQQNGAYGHRRGKGKRRNNKRSFVGQQHNGYQRGGGQRW